MFCFWDFDGTLFNSYPHVTAAMCRALNRYAIRHDPAVVDRLLRESVSACCSYYHLTPGQIACFSDLENDVSLLPEAIPFPETGQVLSALQEKGFVQYVYTHRDKLTFYYLSKYGLSHFFRGYITEEDGFPHKPAPDALQYVVQRDGLPPEDCVMIGDREIDVLAGKNAGIHAVLFAPEGVKSTAADAVIHNLKELEVILPWKK